MSYEKHKKDDLSLVDDLYREVILQRFKSPKNKGELSNPTHQSEGINPSCGDQIHVTIRIEGDVIKEINFNGHGCSISQASASIMAESVTGQSEEKAKQFAAGFKTSLGVKEGGGGSLTLEDINDDAVVFEILKKDPTRLKCGLLPWNTLLEALKNKK